MNTWLGAVFWGVPPDPAVPAYAIGGLGGLALAVRYLRGIDLSRPAERLEVGRTARSVTAA